MAQVSSVYDVIVVGAGPAGAVAACRCAELGLRTLLIDRKAFPRFKACGGGLTRAAQASLGGRLPQRALETSCDRLIADFGGKRVDIRMSRPFLVTVRREVFDLCLVEAAIAAGAEFAPGLEAEDVSPGSDHIEVVVRPAGHGGGDLGWPAERRRASVLITADGVMGKVGRRLVGPPNPADLAFCLVAEAEPDGRGLTIVRAGSVVPLPESGSGEGGERASGAVHCFYGEVLAGYGWIFPLNGCLNVGLGAPGARAKEVPAKWPEFLHRNGLRVLGKVRGAHVPVGGPRPRLAGKRWMLVGDAAGLADPFSGEGLRYAVGSGLLAAETTAEAFAGPCAGLGAGPGPGALDAYGTRVERDLGRELRLASRIQRLIALRPRVMESLFLGNSQAFRHLLGILDGTVTYREMLGRFLPLLPRAYVGALRRE